MIHETAEYYCDCGPVRTASRKSLIPNTGVLSQLYQMSLLYDLFGLDMKNSLEVLSNRMEGKF